MNAEKILDNFSTHLKNVIARAISTAAGLAHREVTPLHLLFAVSNEAGSVGAEILLRIKFAVKPLALRLEAQPKTGELKRRLPGAATATLPSLNADSKKVLERAMLMAFQRGHRHVGTEHLLYALVRQKDHDIETVAQTEKIDLRLLLEEMEVVLQSTSHFPDTDEVRETLTHLGHLAGLDSATRPTEEHLLTAPLPDGKLRPDKTPRRSSPALSLFTVNLTDQERARQTDPVIGRKKEIERLINILARRTKNNPVLVGEAGVGKTAIVEGLAKRIVSGAVPDELKRKQILTLDLTLLISGTIYRGEFEARLKQIIDEVAANPEMILFIDELHNIIGAGANGGTMDAANILKPALAKGQLRCIGATTIDEYSKYIPSDPALERRFQAIHVAEPGADETRAVLQGIKPYYEDFHRVKILDEAIAAAVEFAVRYLHESFLPDKAIDLMDEAAAAVRTARPSSPALRQELALESQLALCRQEKEAAILEEQFDQALALKQRESELAQTLQARRQKRPKKAASRPRVTKCHVAKVLGERLDIPVEYLLQDEWERLGQLEAQLAAEIIGQAPVIERVAQALRHAHLRLGKKRRPFASFLFVGPSGVGKTELATVLAKVLYQDEQSLIRLDMSEFSEAHGVSKLLGSPAGYIGYKERNRFTDTLRRRPYSVVLFDEFDKAHPDVQKLLLQILDSGELTDSHGKKIHFHEAVVILTASIGAELYRSSGIGFGAGNRALQTIVDKETEQMILRRVKELLGGDLVSRIQSACVFAPLSPDHVQSIVRRHLDTLSQQLQTVRQLRIVPDAKALKGLAGRAYTADTGVRHVDHVIQQVIHELLSDILQKQKRKKQYTLTQVANAYKLM